MMDRETVKEQLENIFIIGYENKVNTEDCDGSVREKMIDWMTGEVISFIDEARVETVETVRVWAKKFNDIALLNFLSTLSNKEQENPNGVEEIKNPFAISCPGHKGDRELFEKIFSKLNELCRKFTEHVKEKK